MILPSIDISEGKAVQLMQGKDHLLTSDRDPVALAKEFARYGMVAVVDLDAARGIGDNRDIIAQCCKVAPCRVGGGIRTPERVREWIKAGARQVVIGTQATPEFLKEFPREWIVAALDAKGTRVVDQGWTNDTGYDLLERVETLTPYCDEFLFTQVDREGLLKGPDLETAKALAARTDRKITVAGGIRNAEDITAIEALEMNAQIGRAIYDGTLDLTDAFVAQVRFNEKGLAPTIAQDASNGNVLMLAYSNAESLASALREGRGTYWSRSRNELWRKGDTSGNTQDLLEARYDCDRDAILFKVTQTGPACHTGSTTCFGQGTPAQLVELEQVLQQRKASISDTEKKSYTQKLLTDKEYLDGKLREEIEEVITAPNRENLTWECGDVLYHLMTRMTAEGITMQDVMNELRGRNR